MFKFKEDPYDFINRICNRCLAIEKEEEEEEEIFGLDEKADVAYLEWKEADINK